MARISYVIRSILILLLASRGWKAYAQETVVSYDEKFGLTRNYINDIERDPSGTIWLATEKGIVRFDGANFIEVEPVSGQFKAASMIRMHALGDQIIIVYEGAGLQRFDLSGFKVSDITSIPVADAEQKGPDTLFILQRDGWLIQQVRGKAIHKRHFDFGARKALLKNWQDKLLMVIQGQDALVLSTLDLSTTESSTLQLDYRGVELHFEEFGGDLYFFSDRRAFRISPYIQVSEVQDPSRDKALNTDYIGFITPDRYFFIENNKRLFSMDHGIRHQVKLNDLGNLELRTLLVQDSTHILLGTNQGLFQIRSNSSPIGHLVEPDRVRETDLRIRRRILPWKDGRLVLLGFPYAYFHEQNDSFRAIVSNMVSSYDGVLDGDDLYMGTEGHGMIHVNLNDPHYDMVETGPFQMDDRFSGIHHDHGSDTIFVGVRDSLLAYDRVRHTGATVWRTTKAEGLRVVKRDPDDRSWWIGCYDGMYHLTSGFSLIEHVKEGPGSIGGTVVSDLLIERRTGRLWVAHENGVDILDRRTGRIVDRVPPSLFSNPKVTAMVQDKKDRVWMSTYSGILGFDPESRAYVKLGRENGLINNEFNFTSSGQLPDGRIIFGGLNGYDILEPGKFDFSMLKTEGLFTGYAIISNSDTAFSNFNPTMPGSINFDVDKEMLRIYLSARNRPEAAFYKYEYKLNGDNWIPVKGAPFIDLFNLEPDEYSLQVRAFDQYGTLIAFPPMKVAAKVPFFKSNLFIRFLMVVLGLLLGLYIFMLLNQRKREQDLKEKIAMDLHDEVGTILTRSLYMTRTTAIQGEKGRLEQFLNEALYSLRAYIHTMNRSDFTLGQLRDEVRDLLGTTLRGAGYEADIEFRADERTPVNPELYRDIKLSLYEIMTNTARHAGGDRFKFRLSEEQGKLYISTCDNGLLTDVSQIQEKGNGIRNLLKRVKRHNGGARFSIAGNGHGLQIDMTMSLGS